MSDARARAEAICASLPEPTRARAVELAENVLWMEAKLANAREVIGRSSVAIPYDNGGGQRGIRKNPAFDGYNSLMSSYTKALKQLCEMLGVQEVDGGDDDLDAILASTAKTRATRAGLVCAAPGSIQPLR